MFNKKELGLIYKAVDLYKNSLSQYQSVEYEDCEEILDKITPNVSRYKRDYVCDHLRGI